MYQRGADIFHNSHIVAPTRCDVLPQNILIFSLSFLSKNVPVSPGRFCFACSEKQNIFLQKIHFFFWCWTHFIHKYRLYYNCINEELIYFITHTSQCPHAVMYSLKFFNFFSFLLKQEALRQSPGAFSFYFEGRTVEAIAYRYFFT